MRIFLLGFMGTGKTYWGNQWAEAYGVNFFDLDKEIEKTEGQTIAYIFEKKGEEYFRKTEAKVLRQLADQENCIVACGGGAPCFFDNIQWMNDHGTTVLLQASPLFIFDNVQKEKGIRPLLKNMNEAELLFFIEQKLKERMPYYSQAKKTVMAKELTIQSFETIINQSIQ